MTSVMSLISRGLVVFQAQPALLEVADAVGARGDQHLGADLLGLRQPQIGEALALGRVHPDPAAAAAAAQAVLAGVGASPRASSPGVFFSSVSRRVVDAVVPPEVAGVVIGDLLLHRLVELRAGPCSISSSKNSVMCTTSKFTMNSGYSFLNVW